MIEHPELVLENEPDSYRAIRGFDDPPTSRFPNRPNKSRRPLRQVLGIRDEVVHPIGRAVDGDAESFGLPKCRHHVSSCAAATMRRLRGAAAKRPLLASAHRPASADATDGSGRMEA